MNKTADIQSELFEQAVATVIAWREYYHERRHLGKPLALELLDDFVEQMDALAVVTLKTEQARSARTGATE